MFSLQTALVVIGIVVFSGRGHCSFSEKDCEYGKAEGLLNAAVDLFVKAKQSILKGPQDSHLRCPVRHVDCSDLMKNGTTQNGVYRIWPLHRVLPNSWGFDVYCDMTTDGGGWTVIQRRGDFGRAQDYFYETWQKYKEGFGDIEKDFWLGNDKIHALTSQKTFSIRFDLKDVEGDTRIAVYDEFWIDGESNNYTLHVKGYTGNAGDSFVSTHDGMQFTTKDRKNDRHTGNCAVEFKGAWWHNKCHVSNLNGLYLKGPHESFADGIEWHTWKGYKYSLYETEMKIRPLNFKSTDITPM